MKWKEEKINNIPKVIPPINDAIVSLSWRRSLIFGVRIVIKYIMKRGIKTIIGGKQNIHKPAYGKIANAVGLGANGRIIKISP